MIRRSGFKRNPDLDDEDRVKSEVFGLLVDINEPLSSDIIYARYVQAGFSGSLLDVLSALCGLEGEELAKDTAWGWVLK